METETRMATPKQLAYIQRLRETAGAAMGKPIGELTTKEASELIQTLMQKSGWARNVGVVTNGRNGSRQQRNDFSSGAGLGIVFKCCYRRWISSGWNISQHKKTFIKNVLETYALINEIAERATDAGS